MLKSDSPPSRFALRRGSLRLLATLRAKAGGAEGVRTPDLLNAIQALYQLSYDPVQRARNLKSPPLLSNFLPDFSLSLEEIPIATRAQSGNFKAFGIIRSVKFVYVPTEIYAMSSAPVRKMANVFGVAGLFLRLGVTAFGGPATHIV